MSQMRNLRLEDDIECFEIGSNELPWIGSRLSLAKDWVALERQKCLGSIGIESHGDSVAISGRNRVGLVVLPSGRRLTIRSKIPSLTILEWLIYLGEFPGLTSWLPEAGIEPQSTKNDAWHLCIGRLFLNALECITKQRIRKGYVAVALDQPHIQGRVRTEELARQLHRLPRVPQIHRQRTIDTSFNMVLACALDRLPIIFAKGTNTDLKRLSCLRAEWAIIRRDIRDPVTSAIAAQWASPPGYREALQLAKVILIGATLDPGSSMGGQSFTVSLSRIWELAVRHMFAEIRDLTGWIPAPESERTRHWDDSHGSDDPNRWMMADVLVQRDTIRWVLDAKYKRTFGNESRLDRFQMCAYALAFDADRVSLVHPTAVTGEPQQRILLQTHSGSKCITIDSIALPMEAGPEICRNALAASIDMVQM